VRRPARLLLGADDAAVGAGGVLVGFTPSRGDDDPEHGPVSRGDGRAVSAPPSWQVTAGVIVIGRRGTGGPGEAA
jgi:hypothetical protein